jgi:peptidoglycan/LPS O-acetylase OafA/YrhL
LNRAVSGRYLPALDGLRGVAILAVIAYHLRYSWASGGFLGVDLFFVLSGFLITSLLVEGRVGSGHSNLRGFWGARARRLLPALLVMLAVLSIFVALEPGTTDLPQLRGDALATIFYFSNWHLLAAHQSYFTQFEALSPLQHTWSLAIEEQFYLVWPFVIAALFAWRRATNHTGKETWRVTGLWVTVTGTILSAAWMAYLAHEGAGINRMYYGTDTRAFDLLAGATAALLASARPQPEARTRRLLHAASPVSCVVLAVFFVLGGDPGGDARTFMFEGGFFICAVAAAVLVSDVRQLEAGPVGRLLSFRPLRWVGKISYGLYIWHWPIIVELDSARTGLSGLDLAALQVGVTFAISTVSFYLIERPIRDMRRLTFPKVVRLAFAPVGMGAALVSVVLATIPAAASPSEPVLVASNAPGAGHLAGQRTGHVSISLPRGVPSPSKPLKVMLVGDSVMLTQAPAVGAALDSTGEADVVNEAVPGWGLTVDKGWPAEMSLLIRRQRPELVVAMWQWDNFCLLDPRPPDTCALDPSQYRALLERFIRTVLAPGDGVSGLMFEQYPPLGVPYGVAYAQQRLAGEKAWDSLVASMPDVFPGRVMYLPVGPAVELHGHFAAWLPPESDPAAPQSSWVRVRMLDDTHFCPAGAALYAGALASDLTELYHLPAPAREWFTGAWTNDDAVYNQPPGSCPDDHP